MASTGNPLTADSLIGEWLNHPVGGVLIRELLAHGGMNEDVMRPLHMVPLQRLVTLSGGQMSQDIVDDLVARANDAITQPTVDEDPAEDPAEVAVATRDWARDVVVVVGVGAMGEMIARRQGSGRRLLLADVNREALERASSALRGDGFDVTSQLVDVSSHESVAQLAKAAQALGPVAQVAHTAGLSPAQASTQTIIAVNLIGVALVLDAFAEVIAVGGAGIVVSSMAGYGVDVPADVAHRLATGSVEELANLPEAKDLQDAGSAYRLTKRANQLRVQAASVSWGARGARINSISPGVIATPMTEQELAGANGDIVRAMVASSGAGRLGTPSDIADAAAFLLGPTAGFITGIDLLVDGGVVAAQRVS